MARPQKVFRWAAFVVLFAFWLTMSVLLIRSEFGGVGKVASTVPAELVWNKMLTAPDDSTLEILHHGKNIGYCRWAPNVGEELATGKVHSEELEGRVRGPSHYTIDIEGNLLLDPASPRVRFENHAVFGANHTWKEVFFRAAMRPYAWEIRAKSQEQTVKYRVSDGEAQQENVFKFSDFNDPMKVLSEALGMPFLPSLLPGLPPGLKSGSGANKVPVLDQLSLGLQWKARNDWMTIAHAQARVYRLEAHLFDRYQAVAVISRVGEILRIELPDEVVLVNDGLTNY